MLFVYHTKGALDDINETPKEFLITANKLHNCKTILSRIVYKCIQFPPVTSLFFLHLAFFSSNRVINGTNVTMSDEHMWLIPFTEGQDHLLTIDLRHTTPLAGIRVWNYNKSTDDSFRGVSQI